MFAQTTLESAVSVPLSSSISAAASASTSQVSFSSCRSWSPAATRKARYPAWDRQIFWNPWIALDTVLNLKIKLDLLKHVSREAPDVFTQSSHFQPRLVGWQWLLPQWLKFPPVPSPSSSASMQVDRSPPLSRPLAPLGRRHPGEGSWKAPGLPAAPDGMENAGCILSERIATKKTTPKCLKVDVISASLEYWNLIVHLNFVHSLRLRGPHPLGCQFIIFIPSFRRAELTSNNHHSYTSI